MSSYLSYFTSKGEGLSYSQQTPPPSSGGSTWSNTFSSRIATLRKALTKDSEEDDPDNEDCSHVSNVLRAYYTEKGRAFPDWLPPDPKKPVAPVLQVQGQYGQLGNQYSGYGGVQYGNQQSHSRGSSGGKGGLSDLWDPSPAQVPPPLQSLRTARPTPQSLRSNDSTGSNRGMGPAPSPPAQIPRPLPSQRSGSYQNMQSANAGSLGSRDRLRARLQGGGSGRSSPASMSSMSNVVSQNTQVQQGGSYSSQGSGRGGYPYASASEPSASGQDDFYSGDYNAQSASRQRPGGAR